MSIVSRGNGPHDDFEYYSPPKKKEKIQMKSFELHYSNEWGYTYCGDAPSKHLGSILRDMDKCNKAIVVVDIPKGFMLLENLKDIADYKGVQYLNQNQEWDHSSGLRGMPGVYIVPGTREMTKKEIEAKLGYEIEIVEED